MKLVVLKGWASCDTFYQKLLGFDIHIGLGGISPDEEIAVFAWSMGTMEILEKLGEYNIKKLVLAAPTSNFCSSTNPKIVRLMEKNLDKNKEKVLFNFVMDNFHDQELARAYWKKYSSEILSINTEILKEGLEYLRIMNFIPKYNEIETLILTGKHDKIIPWENTRNLMDSFGNLKHVIFERGHNFLYENDKFSEVVRGFLVD
jgi:pimeloyl-ACP methyl ester carboxylesterase